MKGGGEGRRRREEEKGEDPRRLGGGDTRSPCDAASCSYSSLPLPSRRDLTINQYIYESQCSRENDRQGRGCWTFARLFDFIRAIVNLFNVGGRGGGRGIIGRLVRRLIFAIGVILSAIPNRLLSDFSTSLTKQLRSQ